MIGLIAFIVLAGFLALAIWVFLWTHKTMRGNGKSGALATAWAFGAVIALSLPITWDAIPTWIAFKYYAHKEVGLTVLKTLEQWKAENPGVAETLEPYGKDYNDRRTKAIELKDNKTRRMLNARFAFDLEILNPVLSVHLVHQDIVDTKTGELMVRFSGAGSGNSGGLALGGTGWWKFWNLHITSRPEQETMFNGYKRSYQFLDNK